MHESLVSGDDCTEVRKKKRKEKKKARRSKAKNEGKRDGAAEENGERWKRVCRGSERAGRRRDDIAEEGHGGERAD